MTAETESGGRHVTSVAERMYPGLDPAAVWALVADPARAGEWAGVMPVGYMGKELPEVGHALFVKTAPWQSRSRARRVEVLSWSAGSGYSCRVTGTRLVDDVEFAARVEPVVGAAGVSTRVRVALQAAVPRLLEVPLRWLAGLKTQRMLARIGKRALA
jgi:hypothetical protein